MNLSEYLKASKVDENLQTLVLAISSACVEVSAAIGGGNVGYAGTENSFGEKQLALDVQADNIISGILKESGLVKTFSSEELDVAQELETGRYAVAYDPLDGSSLVDVNFAVGSIFSVYEGDNFIGRKGSEQVAAVVAVYGPRITLLVSVGHGTCEFLFTGNEFKLSKHQISVKASASTFAPGNLRACKTEEKYLKLLNDWVTNGYTLRYSGGMVPDVNHIFLKEQGVFTYPGYSEAPNGKLRLLYECAPMAFLMEQAGGSASDGNMRILDKPIEDLHQRTPVFLGSKEEVRKVEQFLA